MMNLFNVFQSLERVYSVFVARPFRRLIVDDNPFRVKHHLHWTERTMSENMREEVALYV